MATMRTVVTMAKRSVVAKGSVRTKRPTVAKETSSTTAMSTAAKRAIFSRAERAAPRCLISTGGSVGSCLRGGLLKIRGK